MDSKEQITTITYSQGIHLQCAWVTSGKVYLEIRSKSVQMLTIPKCAKSTQY